MKKILTSLFRWMGAAAMAAALLPAVARAALHPDELSLLDAPGTYNTGSELLFMLHATFDDPSDLLNEETIPGDFRLVFTLSDGTTREADFLGSILEGDDYYLQFIYVVDQNDYSAGLGSPSGSFFAMSVETARAIKNMAGATVGNLMKMWKTYPAGDVIPLQDQYDIENVLLNPANANKFSIAFLDEYSLPLPTEKPYVMHEGDMGIPYEINVGMKPATPLEVIINWGAENVFCEGSATTNYVTESRQTFYIDRVLDDGAVPALTRKHTYTITAVAAGRDDATMKATVENVDPEIISFFGSVLLATNTVLSMGEAIDVTARIEDVAGQLDEISPDQPLDVRWSFGGEQPETITTQWRGSFWESTAHGIVSKMGNFMVSFSVMDKDGGPASTNVTMKVERGPLLSALPLESIRDGIVNFGEGSISILHPGNGTIAWVRDPGNFIGDTFAEVQANPFSAAESSNGYDSFYYKWYCAADQGLDPSDTTRALMSGYNPITGRAMVNMLADSAVKEDEAVPVTRTVDYYFSRELYRPDNFGDIDGDGLGDEWEIRWFSATAAAFTNPATEEPINPAESGAPFYENDELVYDFSGTGNTDGDGLPANCFGDIDYTVEADILNKDGSVLIPAGTYRIQAFTYPLDPATVQKFGYLPLGGTGIGGYEEERDVLAFRSNPYVDQNALENILINFTNELEFRGIGLFYDFNDGVEEINFRPFGDGDEPYTNPLVRDSDSDGMPDGWEYYFWAVAYYNIGSDQWLAFDGSAPVAGSFKGTGRPIAREDILATLNPTLRDSLFLDIDNDGLTNLEEFALGTNPIHWDTDGDGMPDGWEVEYGTLGSTSTTVTTDEEGNVSTSISNTESLVLNPLDPKDADYNDDGDWFAIDGNNRHYNVFLANDFDPRVGWCNPEVMTVTYAGNSFIVAYPCTAKFTALEEFNLAAYAVESGLVPEITSQDAGAGSHWSKWATDPRTPDTDGDGMPDGWEPYVGLDPLDPQDAGLDLEVDMLHPDGDGLNNLNEFLCTMAAEQYPYIAENTAYMEIINGWSNKPWPTNPNYSIGVNYANGGDTDNDQILDGFERDVNTNPTACDTDHDYLPDLWECYYGTDPLMRDTHMDYDGDGLQNWQEYLTGAVWAWQYDKWYNAFRGTTGPGYGEVDMFDFFADSDAIVDYQTSNTHQYGGFGRAPHLWDCGAGASARQAGAAGAGAPFYFLSAESRIGAVEPKLWEDSAAFNNYGVNGVGAEELRNRGVVKYATTDPWAVDSDYDGMDDFYEAYHGLNPLYGGVMLNPQYDLVGMVDPVTMSPYPSEPWDLTTYPWLSGDPSADPDKDGLSSREEAANFYVKGGTHHTDPSPYWLTDTTYERSFVNLYYQTGNTFTIPIPPYWYFGLDGGILNPVYAFSFETNEGYDSDNDNIGDRSELATDELYSKADPLDGDNPRRRKAMYFNGVDAACRTRGSYTTEDQNDLRTFTVEAWVCPVNPASGRVQTLIERSAIVPQDTAKGGTSGKRLNFRLSITEIGTLRGEFHNYQGAHVTMETSIQNTGLRAGVWSHVALIYSGMPSKSGTLTIFVDGISRKSETSNLQAFNGFLQDYTVTYAPDATETVEEMYVRATACPIVLGASDMYPTGEVNGSQAFAHGGTMPPSREPELTDFFEGWMDEVRIWDGARSADGLRSTMYTRFDRALSMSYVASTDKINNNRIGLRHHYAFDNLPDTVAAADRSSDAFLFPSDVETLPSGFADIYTAPNDGSYPGIPWWNSSAYSSYRYDTRHVPWIEDMIGHLPKPVIKDSPRVIAIVNDAGRAEGYYENYYQIDAMGRNRMLTVTPGVPQPLSWLPNSSDIYGSGYTTHRYMSNMEAVISAPGATNMVAGANGQTNAVALPANVSSITFSDYSTDEGTLDEDEEFFWFADLLPLGGAVADIDVALWDGLGVGYELVTIDSDGDGMPDYWETLYGLDPFDPSDAWEDFDGDGLDNLAEYLAGTGPNDADSDGDGYSDYYDRDTNKTLTYGELYDDGDGMPSWWEVQHGLNPRVYDANDDLDGDGWSNYSEYLAGTDPAHGSLFPEPPVMATVHYDGDVHDGQVVLYAYSNEKMDGMPDAIYSQEIRGKGPDTINIENEYIGTVKEGVHTYSGKLALGNLINDGSFVIDIYDNEWHRQESLSFAAAALDVPSAFYCEACGKRYAYSQMLNVTVDPTCPEGHAAPFVWAIYGFGSKLSNQLGDEGIIDYTTGEWSINLSFEDAANCTIVAKYSTYAGTTFSLEMRRKWTTMLPEDHMYQSGHLREGKNWFFAFIDQNENFLYDSGEPAGMALYQEVNVGAGEVKLELTLTDMLTGFPRFGWEPVEGADGYSVTVTTPSGASILSNYTLSAMRPFFMEQDLLPQGGANLGGSNVAIMDWMVHPIYNDYNPGISGNPVDPIVSGSVTNSLSSPARKTLSIVSPSVGSIVSDASLMLKWKMDYRNQGARIVIKNIDTNKTYIDTVSYFPRRVGKLETDYFYTIEPQKLLENNTFVDLPNGKYTVTITENLRNSSIAKQSATAEFIIDHSDSVDVNGKDDMLGSISGTITYYGKIPFTVEDEILYTYDGTTHLATSAISRTPVPGTVSVRVVQGNTVLFAASDIGALEGYPRQGLQSTYGSMIQGASYVEYGDTPALSLELEVAPPAGSQLVITYKQSSCPIRVQAFPAALGLGATFSVAPSAQVTCTSKGAFELNGLPQGSYTLRAFLDQNNNYIADPWESIGYAMYPTRKDIGINNFATFTLPPRVTNVSIVLADKDTDNDMLPDAWEYYYFQNLTAQGGQTMSKVNTYLWQEYADGELDSNPLVEDTDGDGLPDVVEHAVGSDNHSFDTDGDGVGDLEEFLAGSNPCDPTSTSRFKAPAPIFLEDGTPALCLETPALTPGLYIQYTLLGKDKLEDEWVEVGKSPLIGVYKTEPNGVARGTTTIADPDAIDSAFYKVKVSFESDTILTK